MTLSFDAKTETSIQGYTENAINPATDATWALLEPLSLEVASLFPINILHLGCDELAPNTWDGSPAVSALKAREGLATRDDVQGWTMRRLAAHLATNGVRSAAWEEAARGSIGCIANNAILFSWTGQGPGVAAARAVMMWLWPRRRTSILIWPTVMTPMIGVPLGRPLSVCKRQ